jgi:hypothetical protein
MSDTRTVKKIFNWNPLTKRSQGTPKYRWEDNIKQDICQLKIQNWIACVQDRGKWKEVVEKAKTFIIIINNNNNKNPFSLFIGRTLY